MWNCAKKIVRISAWVSTLLLSKAGYSQTDSLVVDTAAVLNATSTSTNAVPGSFFGKPLYDFINPSREGLRPTAFYSSDDRFFVGLNYNRFSNNWQPDSTGARHQVYAHYSINQNAFSVAYQGIYHQLIGRWNLLVEAGYDWERWINFSGLGNESLPQTGDADFFRIRSREGTLKVGFQHRLGQQSVVLLTPFYQQIQLLRDDDRFLAKASFEGKALKNYEASHFGGLRADLQLQRLNDLLLPTKGITFSTGVAHVRNLVSPKAYTNFSADTRLYFPFFQHFVYSVAGGAATLVGEPEFYQLNSIGDNTLRGFRGDRFWGETVFHNNNELQYLFNAPEKLFHGKMGALIFFDQGRVWKKGETSDQWHYGYGVGIILAAYQKASLSVQYAISNERKGFHLQLRSAL